MRSRTAHLASVACIVATLLAILFVPAAAQQAPDPLCMQAAKIPIPQADLPSARGNDLSGCSSWSFYYDEPRDVRLARYCAYSEMAQKSGPEDDSWPATLEAPSVLAMIYANGRGVEPNLPLAVHFACEIQDWNGDGRDIAHLIDGARKNGAKSFDFDVCDHRIEREMNYRCLLRDQNRMEALVTVAQNRIDTGKDAGQHAAFQKLLQAKHALDDTPLEPVPSGTSGLAQQAMQDGVDSQQDWVNTLDDLFFGKLPGFTAADFAKADAELNAAYRQARKKSDACTGGDECTTTDMLVKNERAWLAYRDAWAAFGALRWPGVSADGWKTWQTQLQTSALKALQAGP